MGALYLLLPTFLVILLSFLVVRTAAIILMKTGMDRHKAVFQALSAFSGTGFTTREAELIVNNASRRKVISWLMVLGNAGIVTVIISTTSSFVTSRGLQIPLNILLTVLGVFVIYRIASRRGFVLRWERFIKKRLLKNITPDEDAVEDLLQLIEGFSIVRVIVKKGSSFAEVTLSESGLKQKGVLILGIERADSWVSIPEAGEVIQPEDRLIIYGPVKTLHEEFENENQETDSNNRENETTDKNLKSNEADESGSGSTGKAVKKQ